MLILVYTPVSSKVYLFDNIKWQNNSYCY